MTKQRDLLTTTFRQLMEAFPHAFFTKGADVQSLKIGITTELLAALPSGVNPREAKRFLAWYVNRPAYLKALARGAGRVDLTGVVVDTDMPEAVRQQAKQRLEAVQPAPATTPPRSGPMPSRPPASCRPQPLSSLNLEELYAVATDAKLEVTLKFSTLPNAKPAGQGKMAFALKTPDGQFITAEVSNKVWNKLAKTAEEWPSWIAALTGPMRPRTEKGFTLATPGLQVFEKKAKAADSLAPTASAPTLVPAAPPPPASPVTVTTGAGTATVTVTGRTPLSLKRNTSTEGTPG